MILLYLLELQSEHRANGKLNNKIRNVFSRFNMYIHIITEILWHKSTSVEPTFLPHMAIGIEPTIMGIRAPITCYIYLLILTHIYCY